jgi:hypothetical protein
MPPATADIDWGARAFTMEGRVAPWRRKPVGRADGATDGDGERREEKGGTMAFAALLFPSLPVTVGPVEPGQQASVPPLHGGLLGVLWLCSMALHDSMVN